MKTIVTHMSVDLDAVAAVWLIKKYLPGWEDADIKFVSAGKTLNNILPDSDANILHVDTGMGKFDHHQEYNLNLSATKKVLDFLQKNKHIKSKDEKALIRMVDFISCIDNFGEVSFPDPSSDIYDFCLHQTVVGIRSVTSSDLLRCEMMFKMLDGTLQVFKNKINAEEEIKVGYSFKSKWGRTLAIESSNEEVVKLAQKLGYDMAITKDPKNGFIRIKIKPSSKFDLDVLYEKLKEADPKADWFFHVSKKMLLNGSLKNPDMKASTLTLKKVIDIINNI